MILAATKAGARYYIRLDNLQVAMVITAVLISILYTSSTGMTRICNLVSSILVILLTVLIPILAYLLDSVAQDSKSHHPAGGGAHLVPTTTTTSR